MKNFILMGLVAMALSFGAFAKDDQVTIEGNHILVTDVNKLGFGNNDLHTNDLKNGVYIMVSNGPNIDSHLQNAERAIAEVFKSYGIKVADSLEGSSVAIRWGSDLALDMVKADQAVAYSSGPNANQVIAGGGQMIGAVYNSVHAAAGGAGGLVGFVAGELFNTDTKLVLQAGVYRDPVIGKVGLFGVKGLKSASNRNDTDTATIFYKLEKGKEASDDVVLKMAVGQWIKHYVIFDAPTMEAATPAAAVDEISPNTGNTH